MTERPFGEIITFYSYKGGTGRTMALANIACLLARADSVSGLVAQPRVLAIDWDFEAPGLHQYFHRYLQPDSAMHFKDARGCLELFEQLEEERAARNLYDPEDFVANRQRARSWFEAQDLDSYLLATSFPGLFLMKAGRFDDGYPRRVSEFRWDKLFYETAGLFTGFADFLRSKFDYVLLDSRTGTTDTGGICTMLLPDKLVVVFTPNQQSLTGIENLAAEAVAYRKDSPDGRSLTIFPLPSRVDTSRPMLVEAWRYGRVSSDPSSASMFPPDMSGYQPIFERLFSKLYERSDVHLDEYFNEVILQHVSDYAYGEPIAVVLEASDTHIFLSRSYSAFRDRLIELDVPWSALAVVRQERDIVRRCEAITLELMEKSVDEAVKLSFSLIEQKPPEYLFERWTDAILAAARAAKQENRAAALGLIREWFRSATSLSDIDQSKLGAALLTAGATSQELGELVTAKELLGASRSCFTDSFGNQHPMTLAAIDQLASVVFANGELGEARRLYENALQVRRKTLGDQNPATLETINNLALVQFEEGDIVASKDILQHALAMYRQMAGGRWRAIRELTSDTLTHIEVRELAAARTLLGQLQAEFRRGERQENAIANATSSIGSEDRKAPGRRVISTEPIATVDIVRPDDLAELVDQDLLYLAPGYRRIDKMPAQPVNIGDKRIDFVAIQACMLDGATLIWQSQNSGTVWAKFGGDIVEVSRGETLRLYLNWIGW